MFSNFTALIPEEMETNEQAQTKSDSTTTDAAPENTEGSPAEASRVKTSPMGGCSSESAGSSQAAQEDDSANQQESAPGDRTLSELPFQLQVCYTDTDGMKALRVLTQVKPVTQDRSVAEQSKMAHL